MPKSLKKSTKTRTILIVEDEHPIARTLQLKLEHNGFAAVCAANGEEALTILSSTAIDLILLDLVMPIMDGFVVLEELKKKKNTPPIIVLTNLGQDDDAKRCLALGAQEYIIKAETPLADIIGKISHTLGV